MWGAIAWGVLLTACSDGVGEPIRVDGLSLAAGGNTNADQTSLDEVITTDADGTGGTGGSGFDVGGQPGTAGGGAADEELPGASSSSGGTPGGSPAGGNGGSEAGTFPANDGIAGDDAFRDGQGRPGPRGGSQSAGDPNAVTVGAVPDEGVCASVNAWLLIDTGLEDGMLNAINTARALGTPCSAPGAEQQIPFLMMSPELRCASRLHSREMVERGYFGEINPEGESPRDRIAAAGFEATESAEVIARGDAPPYDILSQLLGDPSTCEELVNPAFTHVGVGFFAGRWTIDLARP